jgi:hypothetical protein
MLLVLLNAYRLVELPLELIYNECRFYVKSHYMIDQRAPVEKNRSALPTPKRTYNIWFLRHGPRTLLV